MDQRLQLLALGSSTYDLDAQNFLFTAIPQVLDRLELLDLDAFMCEVSLLRRLRDDRARVCEECLNLTEA